MLPDREWLTVEDVATEFSFSIEHIRRICRGEIRGVSLRTARLSGNGNWRIHRDSAAKLIQAGK